MSLTATSSLRDVVTVVSRALRHAGIRAVLTGGACASLHSDGAYLSHDLDYILESRATQRQLDTAMRSIDFRRVGDRYVHPATVFFVEFPRGPLAIGDDDLVTPVEVRAGTATILTLSPTDACRDRLAAFYHWRDRQSLDAAIKIARRRPVNVAAIRRWSEHEGFADAFREFERAAKRRRPRA